MDNPAINRGLNREIKNYQQTVYLKAQQLLQTDKVKAITANFFNQPTAKDFGILEGEGVKSVQLESLILYTSYSKFCTAFSRSFGKISSFEILKAVKERNKYFYFMSKYLIEAVNCFGINGFGEYDEQLDEVINKESGPFYSGINCVINIPSFRIRLRAPTSTTKQPQVAYNFADHDGMVLSLNNNNEPAALCKFFSVTWLSRYPEEDERLFVHGHYPMEWKPFD